MRKFILTETQMKKLIDNIILRETNIVESSEVYTLPELAEILSRTGYDEQTLLEVLVDVRKGGGDDGVVKLVRISTGIDIESIGNGKYTFKLT